MLHVSIDLACSHERGHRGNPYNELADTLCTQLSDSPLRGDTLCECTPALEFTENPLMAQWAFVMMLRAWDGRHDLEVVTDAAYTVCGMVHINRRKHNRGPNREIWRPLYEELDKKVGGLPSLR